VCQEKITVTMYGEWGFSIVEMRITLKTLRLWKMKDDSRAY
jgi:hypothetical protein